MRAFRLFAAALIPLVLCLGCKKKPVATTTPLATIITPALHEAAEAGDAARVQALIAGGADLGAKDRYSRTALHVAINSGQEAIVELLISAGADVNAVDVDGNTPLFCAIDSEKSSITRLLLAHGATVRTVNVSGKTPLSKAIQLRDTSLVELLIARGADVNAKLAPASSTPLQLAAEYGQKEIIESLLAAGAEINAADTWGFTALHKALRARDVDPDIARLLLARGADARTQTHDGETLLHVAAKIGYDDIVANLIAGGADVNAVDRPGDTPVLYAARYGHLDIVRRLVAEGASVNVANKQGETPLTEAVAYGEPDLVKFLISQGASVNVRRRKSQYTPLHIAAYYGWKPVAELLIAAGAPLNAAGAIGIDDPWGPTPRPTARSRKRGSPGVPPGPGQTPVQVAMKMGHSKIVRLLAERGAEVTIHQAAYLGQIDKAREILAGGVQVDAQDVYGWTALRWAAQEGHEDVVRLLLTHGADINGKSSNGVPLLAAMRRGHNDIAALLVMNGAALNGTSDEYGMTTPLEMAISKGLRDLVELLISKGALGKPGSDAVNQALLSAAESGRRDMVELFLAKGANVSKAIGGVRWTALQCAAAQGHEDIVQLLIAKGADVDAVNDWGESAIDLAMEWDHREIVKLLAAHGADLTIHAAAYIGDSNAVQHLLSRGADINAMDEHGRTALSLAAGEGNMAVAELLIARGAEVDRGKEDSWLPTPLYAAAERGQTGMVKLLIRHGANIHPGTLEDYTPLHEAARQGHRETVELLIDKGVEVNARAAWKSTALREAALRGHAGVVEILLTRGAQIIAGEEDAGIVLPDPHRQSVAETARLLIEAYAPYTIIVTDRHEVRSFLKGHVIPFDDVWTPSQADIQGLDSVVKASLEEDSSVIASSWLDREYVLRNYRRYNQEFGGFIDNGVKYLICSMVLSHSFYRPPPNARFAIVADGGSAVLRIIFNAETRSVTKIECNGEA